MNNTIKVEAIPDPSVAGRIVLRNVRVAYADGLNAAKEGKPDPSGKVGAARFSASFLIPESEGEALQGVYAAMLQVATQKWRDRATVVMQELQAGNRLAMRAGATKASQEGFLGNWYISAAAKATEPPVLLDCYLNPQGTGPQVLNRPQSRIYSGSYVNVQLDFWPQDNADGGKRINCQMKVVQFAAEGESFGGGSAADTSVFGAVAAPSAGGSAFTATPAAPGFAAPQAPGFAAPPAPGFAAPGLHPAPGFAPTAPQQPAQFPPGFKPPF